MASDGTKVLASASKHSAVSYARAGEMIEQLELEVQQLLARAEQADATALQEGLTIPGEIVRRQERKAALAQARAEIEAWAQMRFAAQLAKRAAKRARREKVGGKPPQAPTPAPEPGNQYNFTNAESRIMEAGHGNHFEQNYKAQAAVEAESRLIVGQRVSQSPNGKAELVPTLSAMPARPGEGVAGMDAGLPGLQSQTAPSVGRGAETGGCGLKTGPAPPTGDTARGAHRWPARERADFLRPPAVRSRHSNRSGPLSARLHPRLEPSPTGSYENADLIAGLEADGPAPAGLGAWNAS